MQEFQGGIGPETGPERALRVLKFTDTVADVNGVCRFIQNAARRAGETGRDLTVVTSTRIPLPEEARLDNLINFRPILATRMPKYENLELALPPAPAMLAHARRARPHVVHVSTPGPVGCVGMLAARLMRVPVVGVYHTDFPAYVDRLFDDRAATAVCERLMGAFYRPFQAVFTRSADYAARLRSLGIREDRLVRLRAGFDDRCFGSRFRDPGVWAPHGIDPGSVKVLFCGRVSVEKSLPLLAGVWPSVRRAAAERGVAADLVIVGDGPYRATMERDLRGAGAHFLGFRHGEELARLYASCDLFAFPSTTDTLGQVVMESQASGVPVLVTDRGGPREIVHDGRTGLVLPAEDRHAWTRALVDLVCDHERRGAMGAAAAEAMKDHSFAASFEHYWQVHERAARTTQCPDSSTSPERQ